MFVVLVHESNLGQVIWEAGERSMMAASSSMLMSSLVKLSSFAI
jgi:hypothetical protein